MPVLTRAMVPGAVATGGSTRVNAAVAPRFRKGDAVRTLMLNPPTHIRLPRYVRGKLGEIETDHGVFVFPDTSAHGMGEKPQHVYTVRFSAREVFGPGAGPLDSIHVDLWDDYLAPA
jgi:nitrile hydratase